MFRIGVTQRVDSFPDRAERRDALDQAWAPVLQEVGCVPVPIPNLVEEVVAFVEGLGLRGLILSGGNDLAHLPGARQGAPERDACERALLEWASEKDVPVLGVCRGLQFLADHHGATLEPVSGHAGNPHGLKVPSRTDAVLELEARDRVNSYHDWALSEAALGPELRAIAFAPDGSVEALAHRRHRQAGIMWHPERSPRDSRDLDLLRRFFTDGS